MGAPAGTEDEACTSLLSDPQFRESLYLTARGQTGRTLDSRTYAFSDDGHNLQADLQVRFSLSR